MPSFRILGQVVQIAPRQFIAIASAVPVEGAKGTMVLTDCTPGREEGLKALGVMVDQIREALNQRGDGVRE